MMSSEPIYLTGQTGSGKSALAVELALHLRGEIVNADAFQLYRGLEICSAQPTREDQAKVPHHLYGVLSPDTLCDAASYAAMAREVITSLQARDCRPIIVGGSGLYVKALTHGLSDLPSDGKLREGLALLSPEERVSRLLELDPVAAETMNLRNDRYVTRALEICLLTGKPQSELRQAWKESAPEFLGIALELGKDTLINRIEQRVVAMVEAGLVSEIAALPALSSTAARAIGVPQIQAHLRGEITLPEAVEAIQIATRQYARQQRKWVRRETGFKVLPASAQDSAQSLLPLCLSILNLPEVR